MVYRLLAVAMMAMALALFVSQAVLAADETHEGIVVTAGEGKLTMSDKEGNNKHTHEVALDARITLDGKAAKLADLKTGHKVKVTAKDDAKKTATKIEAKSK